jgi:hypothetical protein
MQEDQNGVIEYHNGRNYVETVIGNDRLIILRQKETCWPTMDV